MSYPDWAASFTAWVQSLHADVWLVKVDAHILGPPVARG